MRLRDRFVRQRQTDVIRSSVVEVGINTHPIVEAEREMEES
jgi:hypothetical protein